MSPARPTLGLIDPGDGLGGNRVTALRWARLLRARGWHVFRAPRWQGRPCDALIVIHAERGAASIRRWRDERGDAPLVVCAAGTDLYGPRGLTPEARAGFAAADVIVVLQELGLEALPRGLRPRARVLHQSAPTIAPVERADGDLEAVVLAHLRPVKDPLLAARAVTRLPASSRWRVVLIGALRDESLRAELERLLASPRFEWTGGLRRRAALARLAAADLLVSTSRHEGGSNAITEALGAGKPILSTDIPGSRGLLGDAHPGWFRVGDDEELAGLLASYEDDAAWRDALRAATRARRWIVDPRRESAAWRELLDELLGDACP